jgi:hypothetical protein
MAGGGDRGADALARRVTAPTVLARLPLARPRRDRATASSVTLRIYARLRIGDILAMQDEEQTCRHTVLRLYDILRMTTDQKARDAIRQIIDDLERKLEE